MSDQIVAGIIGAAVGGILVAIVVAMAKRGWAVHKRASEAVTIDACRDCKDEIGESLAMALEGAIDPLRKDLARGSRHFRAIAMVLKEICTILKLDCDELGKLIEE